MRKALPAAPTDLTEVANVAYVQQINYDPALPPSGQWQLPYGYLNNTTGNPQSGIVYFSRFHAGPGPKSYDQLGLSVTVAQVAGTTTTTLGLYPDDGTGGMPKMSSGPLVSGTITLTATGNRTVALTMNSLSGWYWLAMLYVATSAPTTNATMNTVQNIEAGWSAQATIIGSVSRGLQSASGQTALPTTQISLSPNTGATLPVLAIRAL